MRLFAALLVGAASDCSHWKHQEQVWSSLAPAAQHGPVTLQNVSELSSAVKKLNGWQLYFSEVAIIDGGIWLRQTGVRMGGWLAATLRLVREVASSVPNVLFVLSVHDEAHLERTRFKPLPLLSALTTAAHWDIPVPGQTWFETSGGVSSQGADQDFGLWESKQWQKQLETKYPWENRTQRAFFRGHDWSASNAFTELLPTRPAEHCIKQHDISMSFGYRRWYAELSHGPLKDVLDVGLTGAPDFVKAQNPQQVYVRPVPLPDHAKHKYLLHLDGTAASNRLLKLLLMGSVVLKQDSIYEEYFYKDLKPWVLAQ
ncbi:unnamed protein product [Effrenium voratum]|uniref:Glycosyl transferase CAP10 domain-containing protein n=2 Tax=Effrenium voratum TaxID=2562239 RepID=A0AA36MWK0_9DINO|nr:unnamed protein product [Effrenium voratum]